MRLGIALLRAVIGGLFVGHGLQKLTGSFGGHGLEATGQAFEGMGLRPGKVHATAAGVAETGGGVLLLTGFATPVAAGALTGVMAVAVKKVHLPNGIWATEGGFEYNLVLAAALFAITAAGPGAAALDDRRSGTAWALAEFAAGLAGAAAILKFGDKGVDEQPAGQVSTANGAPQADPVAAA